MSDSQRLYRSHPSMFRNHPIAFVLGVIVPFVGWMALLFWWLACLGTTLEINPDETVLRNGILSKHTNSVRHTDVRQVQVSQGILQRLLRVGNVAISSAGHGGVEIEVSGMPHPQRIKQLIRRNG